MKFVKIQVPTGIDNQAVVAAIETTCREAGLKLALKSDLASYPGSTHWHFKEGATAGTLEITYWPQKKSAWFAVQARRDALWIDQKLPKLKSAIEDGLSLRLAEEAA